MRSIKLIPLILFLSSFTFSQNVIVRINGGPDSADLFQLEGEKKRIVKKLNSLNGEFKYSLNDEAYGFYRFESGN